MDSIFLLFVFFNAFLFVVIIANIVTVGNYSQLNPRSCGLSSILTQPNGICFEWHKDIPSAPIKGKDAVNVTLGDAPWVVLLYVIHGNSLGYCSGAVIADEWILTAAHCVDSKYDDQGNEMKLTDVIIFLGYDFTHNNPNFKRSYKALLPAYVHPKYNSSGSLFDLGLFKMNKPINNTDNRLIENSICLPEKWSQTSGTDCWNDTTDETPCEEYAMVGGWGPGNFTIYGNLTEEPNPLKMGYWQIWNSRNLLNPEEIEEGSIFWMKRVGDQYICSGDSGGPVWQYHLGRAVILGVLSSTFKFEGMIKWTECDMGDNGDQASVMATWVDQEIDWIQNITGLH